jgi:hypothetical protein
MRDCPNLLIVNLVSGLTFRHPSNVKNPSIIEKKTIIIALKFDLLFDLSLPSLNLLSHSKT